MSIETLERSFGLAIAYMVPGAIALAGISLHIRQLQAWFGVVAEKDASFAGFLLLAAGSTALGVMLSAVRAFYLERLTKWAPRPSHPQGQRLRKEAVYQNLVSQHYNYYQCYGNSAVAVVLCAVLYLTSTPASAQQWPWILGSAALVHALLVWAALDALERFEAKRTSLLREPGSNPE